jgi:hypothetical protein
MPELKCLVVFGESDGPNARQRKQLQPLSNFERLPTAVITTSFVARGVVTALSWFGATIRAFAPAFVEDAFSWLGLSTDERLDVLRRVATLKAQLAGIDPGSASLDRAAEIARLTAIVRQRMAALRASFR